MAAESTLTAINSFPGHLKLAKELVYDKCGFDFTNLTVHAESAEYGACSFQLNGKVIQYRLSKITPTKTGQFVTIWQRNQAGLTAPFDLSDNLDFIIISATSGENFGQFIFPKSVLGAKGIISKNDKAGKRGIRVYPPWDIVNNKQAEKTQHWQTKYFLPIRKDNLMDLDLAKKLFSDKALVD